MTQTLRAPKVFVHAPSAILRITVAHGEDLNESIQLLEPNVPMDLTGIGVELMVRTEHESDIPLAHLTSGAGDILFDDQAHGKLQIYYPYWLINGMPTGEWRFHMRLTAPSEAREIARGPFIVLPARYLP